MTDSTHIINKVFLEVNTNSSKEAFELKDNLGVFLKHQVFPSIESYFKKQSVALLGSTLRFNKIEINIDHADFGNLQTIKSKILSQLKEKIDKTFQKGIDNNNDAELVIVSNNKSDMDTLIHFLKTGLQPWWKSNFSGFLNYKNLKTVKGQDDFYAEFVKILSLPRARQRLIHQFDDSILLLLLTTSNSKNITAKRKTFSTLEKNDELRNTFWIAIIDHFRFNDVSRVKKMLRQFTVDKVINAIESEALDNFTSSIINTPIENEEILELSPDKEELHNVNPMEDGLFLNNAGLVLLHPFFKQLFINAEIADTNGNILPSKKETAIHLLHYLCTKEEQQLESELVLEKFLCGFPIEQPINRFIKLPEKLKQMAEEVLQAAIEHWTILKNTSPDGLRSEFLQREGKLILDNDTGRLIVERKGLDILLDSIPWNIHLIKLPWLDKLIHVEW